MINSAFLQVTKATDEKWIVISEKDQSKKRCEETHQHLHLSKNSLCTLHAEVGRENNAYTYKLDLCTAILKNQLAAALMNIHLIRARNKVLQSCLYPFTPVTIALTSYKWLEIHVARFSATRWWHRVQLFVTDKHVCTSTLKHDQVFSKLKKF